MKEARFWTALSDGRVRCMLCAHRCTISEGKTGICAVRRNVHGVLYSLVWGRSIAANVDPIEKKPLYHFLPGTRSFSIATVGCNFRCAFCQNSDISQYPLMTGKITGETFLPEDVVDTALSRGCRGVSYTYTEPTISLEYVLDTAKIAHTRGLLNTMITNGYTATDIISGQLKGLIDGANIDLKAFTETFYTKLCSARLAPVLDAIRAYHDAGIWIEVTTLVIPGENDSKEELTDIASFICSVSPDIPWHLSRYYPRHRYTRADPTPVSTLEAARDIGLSQGLKFVYTGNVMGHAGEHTYCPGCGEIVISRRGFTVEWTALKGTACQHCNHILPGRFE